MSRMRMKKPMGNARREKMLPKFSLRKPKLSLKRFITPFNFGFCEASFGKSSIILFHLT